MLRGSTTLLSAPPGGVPTHASPRSGRHVSRRRARQKRHDPNSHTVRRPKKERAARNDGPRHKEECVGRMWEAGVPSAFVEKQGGPRWGTNPQTTPISVANYVSQQNGQRLNALLILAFFVFFGGWYSLQIKIYYLTFNLYQPFVTTEHYRSTHRPRPCYAGGTSPL